MINVMQLIIHMSQLNVQFPSNAIFFYNMMIDISNFDIVPQYILDKLILSIFGTDDLDGEDSTSILDNIGSVLIYLIALLALVGLVILLKSLSMIFELYAIILLNF
jgi:hypothetical protein